MGVDGCSVLCASVLWFSESRSMPFHTGIWLDGRIAIPKDIPEAAAVDGAGFWRTQLQIVIPMMRPILSVAMLFGLIFTFTDMTRSEEHTSELQSQSNLVCRLLLEKKKIRLNRRAEASSA